ncbi:MAG TPA: hypothetical protein VFN30_10675 [Chitinophagaceae bacterium]|nr:hypothetical protein [Chitinophagaceae bacterium]
MFSLLVTVTFGQRFVYPTIREKGKLINDFVPFGWSILDSTTGDLNNDNHIDAALVLQLDDSTLIVNQDDDFADTITTRPRMLLILFKDDSDSFYHLTKLSNTFILVHDDSFSDDPFQDITIKKGILKIDFYWYPTSGNWFNSNSYKFRYQDKDFYLIGADYEESNKASHDYSRYSYNFLTRKRTFTKGNWDKKTGKSATEVIDFGKLKTIDTLHKPYTWQVENGVIL